MNIFKPRNYNNKKSNYLPGNTKCVLILQIESHHCVAADIVRSKSTDDASLSQIVRWIFQKTRISERPAFQFFHSCFDWRFYFFILPSCSSFIRECYADILLAQFIKLSLVSTSTHVGCRALFVSLCVDVDFIESPYGTSNDFAFDNVHIHLTV